MTALANDRLSQHWHQGHCGKYRRPSTQTMAASVCSWLGGVNMHVNGVARPILSGTALAAVCTAFNGADANGGIYARALAPGVTLALAGGTSKTLAVTSITEGETIAIVIQLGTDGADAVTTTGAVLANFIKGHARLRELIRAEMQGTGASICAIASATAVAHIGMLGVAPRRRDNADNVSALTLHPADAYEVGTFAMLATGTAPTLRDGWVSISDDQTIAKATDNLDFQAPLVHIAGTARYFIDLERAV